MQTLRIGLVISNKTLWDEVQACLQELPVQILLQQQSLGDWSSFLDQVRRLQPDVLLLDITELRDSYAEAFRAIKSNGAGPHIVALNTAPDSDTILGAMRAGASEYLFPPLRNGLSKALERIADERSKVKTEGRQHGGKTLGILSAKGGCGATTIACHLAVAIQRITSQEVLLADFDLAAGMLGFLMKSKSPYSMLDAVRNTHRLDLSYWKALVSNGRPQLEIISAPPAGSVTEYPAADYFKQVLRFTRSGYDWIFADLGRGLTPTSIGLMEEIDELFLVAQLDLQSLHQAKHLIQSLLSFGYNRGRLNLILNRVPRRPDILPDEVEKLLNLPVHTNLPDDYQEIFEAYAQGDLVNEATDLGKHMLRLASRIAGVQLDERPKTKTTFSLF